jgi:hypothetical protein
MKILRAPSLITMMALGLAVLLFGGYTSGTKVVTTAGTRVQLSTATTTCISLTIQVLSTNAGTIWIGGNNVSASGTIGLALSPSVTPPASAAFGPSSTTALYSLSEIWLDATNSGDGVTYACYR